MMGKYSTWRKEEINYCKLSSNLHVYTMTCTRACTHTQRKYMLNKFKILKCKATQVDSKSWTGFLHTSLCHCLCDHLLSPPSALPFLCSTRSLSSPFSLLAFASAAPENNACHTHSRPHTQSWTRVRLLLSMCVLICFRSFFSFRINALSSVIPLLGLCFLCLLAGEALWKSRPFS